MKRFATLACAAGLVLALVGRAGAVQFYLNGSYEFQAQTWNNINLDYTYAFQNTRDFYHNVGQYYGGRQYHQHHTSFQQRWIMQATVVASENLMAYWDGILGYYTWGGPATGAATAAGNVMNPQLYGGALGTRSAGIITRQAFMDWTVPGSKVKLRLGQQFFGLPLFATGPLPINYEFGSGVTLTAPVGDWMDLVVLWCRAASGPRRGNHPKFPSSRHMDDTWDIFAVAPTFKGEGFRLMPNLALSVIGKDALSPGITYLPTAAVPLLPPAARSVAYNGGHGMSYLFEPKVGPDWGFVQDGSNWFPLFAAGVQANINRGTKHQVGKATAYVLGLSGELTAADPFRFAWDVAYSKTETDHREWSRGGWYAGAQASYKTRYGEPLVKVWYASGDDGNVNNGSERAVGGNGGDADMNLWGQSRYGNLLHGYEGGSLFGTWGFSLQWRKASFIDKLDHTLRVAYVQGTNDKNMAFYARRSTYGTESPGFACNYLTTADRLIEIDLDVHYEIMKQLDAMVECSYMIADLDGKVWGRREYAGGPLISGAQFSNPWRLSFYLRYKF